jgi:poly-beta-1,6-N-acetyl-D-glucosamine synthase
VTRQTFRYWAQQMGIGYGVIALSSFMLMMLLMALALDHWVWFPFWLGLGAVFMAERIVTVWPAGWRGRLLAIPLLPELFYDLFLDAVYVKGVLDISIGRTATWKHVAPTHSTQVAGR